MAAVEKFWKINNMKKVYLVGDSFSSNNWASDTDVSCNAWPQLLSTQLDAEVVNKSLIGSSQDYAWVHLHLCQPSITPDDYVIVCLTHPARFWFFENFPMFSTIDQIESYESIHGVGPTSTAARNFIKYFQRKDLDTLWLKNRLGWLANTAYTNSWRKPLIIYSMQIDDLDESHYPDLSFSKGYLHDHISQPELPPGVDYETFVRPYDPRYNHMCLSNHAILAEKLYESLTANIALDLTTDDFKKDIFNIASDDLAFQQRELSMPMMDMIKNYIPVKKKSIIPAQFRFK
jgi:hypothetical protein